MSTKVRAAPKSEEEDGEDEYEALEQKVRSLETANQTLRVQNAQLTKDANAWQQCVKDRDVKIRAYEAERDGLRKKAEEAEQSKVEETRQTEEFYSAAKYNVSLRMLTLMDLSWFLLGLFFVLWPFRLIFRWHAPLGFFAMSVVGLGILYWLYRIHFTKTQRK